MPLEERKLSRFSIVKHSAPEIFAISNEQTTTIIPQMEPDAEIDIPRGTFEQPSEMAVNVSLDNSYFKSLLRIINWILDFVNHMLF